MIRTLRRKFVLITMLLVTLVLLGVVIGVTLYFSSTLRNGSFRMLDSVLNKPHGAPGPNFSIGGQVPEGFGREPVFVVTVEAGGKPRLTQSERFDVGEAELNDITALALEAGVPRGELDAYELRYVMRANGGETKIAFVTLSFEKQQIRNVVTITGLAAAGAFLVFLLASTLLSRWALKPVERSWQRQRRFVADASHELKTPLTVILANARILKQNPQSPVAEQMPWVENTEQEALRMKGLVDDLLFLAKSDDTAEKIALVAVELSDLVATNALSFEPVAFEQGLSLDLQVAPDVEVLGNETQLRQLVAILLDNALKYGAPQSTIFLRLYKRQNQAALSVTNRGERITLEARQHLFDRFYRADASRTKEGYGLGLSIAKTIVETHGGKIEVESEGGETVFTVCLPLRDSERNRGHRCD